MKSAIILLGAIFIVLVSCVSVPEQVRELEKIDSPYTVINHKNAQLGIEVPDWTYKAIPALEEESRFVASYVYRFERVGKNLEGVKILADNLDAGVALAREISLRVQQQFTAEQSGNDELVETYFENIVETLSETTINGYRKYDDFWLLRRHNETEEEEYVYYNLFTVEKETVDNLIQNAISEQPANGEEEEDARERVQSILEDAL